MIIPTNHPGCNLRSWHTNDVPSLVLNANNRNVWNNLTDNFPHPYLEDDAKSWICNTTTEFAHLAIDLDGVAIGGAGIITDKFQLRIGELGYWLGEPFWGRGIASSVVKAMVDHFFAINAFDRLEATVFEWNVPSMRVLEKTGFHRGNLVERHILKNGKLINGIEHSLDRLDWIFNGSGVVNSNAF